MGATLGPLFSRAGHKVVFSYAHRPDKLKRLARPSHTMVGLLIATQ